MTTTTNALDNLIAASSHRSTATDLLHIAVRALLETLETSCELGDGATVAGYELRLVRVRSNVGHRDSWRFCRDDDWSESVDLQLDVDAEKYLHGDFNCKLFGPSRNHLIAFGERAERFVISITKSMTDAATKADAATQACDRAREALDAEPHS